MLSLLVITSTVLANAPDWCADPIPPPLRALTPVDVQDSWFVVYRVRADVYAISEPRQAEQVISYLIVGKRRALLFDSGLGIGAISRVVGRLTQLPVTLLNSHTHFDHVGGNSEFDDVRNEDSPFSKASARGDVSPALAAYALPSLDADHVCGSLPAGIEAKNYEIRTWRIAKNVRDDERFDLGGRQLTVVFTPGHTPDSMCLLDRRNGLLFTGDTFYLGPIYLWAPGTDLQAYARSVRHLAQLAPHLTVLLPAHGIPVASPAELPKLQAAVAQLQSGRLTAVTTKEGRLSYRFEDFSLLLPAQ